ncbi:MAG: hypothetical protein NC131_06065 [Roseburia sp.]|nr:hypothetical protein [Roseburia sp.]
MEKKYPIKTPELIEAKKAIFKFLKSNGLDPRRDYSNHPKFGEEFRKLLFKLNKERDKIAMKYPLTDIKNLKKYVKMKKDKKAKKEAKKAVATEAPVKEAKKKVSKETKSETAKEAKKEKAPRAAAKYNYPLIDGREMTSAEKKKYRAEQRKANNPDAAKKTGKANEAKPEKAKKVAKEEAPAKAEKAKKDKKVLKTSGKKEGKKKAAKEED